MAHGILLTDEAERDLESIEAYVSEHDTPGRAAEVIAHIEATVDALAEFPHRGAHPPELVAFGGEEYREVFFKPYRILYRVQGEQVIVVLIADGRRDLRALLERRLLGR